MADHLRALDTLIGRIEDVVTLTNDEVVAIRALPRKIETLRKGTTIVHQGDQPTKSCVVLDGATCLFKDSPEGGRQILLVHYAGDMPDLQSLQLNVMDAGLATLTPSVLAFFEHQDIRDLSRRFPRLGETFWRASLVDASMLRAWLFNLGQCDAQQRLALFLCETFIRMTSANLGCSGPLPFFLTQLELSQMLGLTPIHVNRVMQELRRKGLVNIHRGKFTVPDFQKLARAAEFDSTYLHLTRAQIAKLAAAGVRKIPHKT